MELYSDNLSSFSGQLPERVQEAIGQIEEYFGADGSEVFQFDEFNIAIKVDYSVPLPSNGALDVDIRPIEPMLICINTNRYPDRCPIIRSNRKDFPKDKLAHLYASKAGEPAKLCLVRNDPSEWFAGVRINDFLATGLQWLYKAGAGLLTTDSNEFDPMRLDLYQGTHVYNYDTFSSVINDNKRLSNEYPMALCLAGLVSADDNVYVKTIKDVPFIAVPDAIKSISELSNNSGAKENVKGEVMFSTLFWHPNQTVEDDPNPQLPRTYKELKMFFQERGINLKEVLQSLENIGTLSQNCLTITYGIRRSKKLIGYNGNHQFVNFLLFLKKHETVNKIKPDTEVLILQHNEPFTSRVAKEISNRLNLNKVMYLGAGSLGSKLILHDARSGNLDITVVDHDDFLPHNLARHGLFSEAIGKNKAFQIINEIKELFGVETTNSMIAMPHSIIFVDNSEIIGHDLILDTTASELVKNHMIERNLHIGTCYVRAEIVDEGNLGLCMSEGENRNPRMDDLTNYICYMGINNDDISGWRKRDADREPTTLNIGLGCSSVTTVISDNIISYHASAISMLQSAGEFKSRDTGKIFISQIETKKSVLSLKSQRYDVAPFELLDCLNQSGWQVRMSSGMSSTFLELTNQHSPKETGGVLVGVANYKLKTVHIFDIIATPDSIGTPTRFNRGTAGLPEKVDKIKELTGEMIGYIGEWHSHPMNLQILSEIDKETIATLQKLNRKVPIPTLAIIVTKDKILPFIFE